MKQKTLFCALLLMTFAGVPCAWGQAGMLVWQNGNYSGYRVESVDSVQFVDNINRFIGSDYVDLGLPSGTLWATCNIGAGSPEESGDFFAWGETKMKDNFSWESYLLCEGTSASLSRYCTSAVCGLVDGRLSLRPENDAASACWGVEWQMPSRDQLLELTNSAYTSTMWTELNGVGGRLITSKSNGNSIFLPASGYCDGTRLSGEGSGYYWTRSLDADACINCAGLFFTQDLQMVSSTRRYYGRLVRPVRSKHDCVDLGLPSGTLWATCNVGAERPDELGDGFAWGETRLKTDFSWETYLHCNGGVHSLTKYCTRSGDGYDGFTDGLKTLEPCDDAATVNWGSEWQMPSEEQLDELFNVDYTTLEFVEENGIPGFKVVSIANGRSIFLPAERINDESDDFNTYLCVLWSCSISSFAPFDGVCYTCYFSDNPDDDLDIVAEGAFAQRFLGQMVRPVKKK